MHRSPDEITIILKEPRNPRGLDSGRAGSTEVVTVAVPAQTASPACTASKNCFLRAARATHGVTWARSHLESDNVGRGPVRCGSGSSRRPLFSAHRALLDIPVCRGCSALVDPLCARPALRRQWGHRRAGRGRRPHDSRPPASSAASR